MTPHNPLSATILNRTLLYLIDDLSNNGPSSYSDGYNLQHYKEHLIIWKQPQNSRSFENVYAYDSPCRLYQTISFKTLIQS